METLILNHNELSTLGEIPLLASLQALHVTHNRLRSLRGVSGLTVLSVRCRLSAALSVTPP
jgi:Leucine-rich repeat (LRR) protein